MKELDRKNLLDGAPLTDSHMNGCGLLISKQFPELQRPQNTLYAQKLDRLQPPKEWSLYFHFYSAHWVLSHFKKGQVYLYDSLQSKMLHPDLKEQLLALYGETDIELVPVQVQSGTRDCGCFVIAFSISLLFGDDPSKLVYKQCDMRKHLEECLSKQHFTPFPANEKRTKKIAASCKLRLQ